MSDQDDTAEKSHEPTPRKLEKAREKGEIARSTDLNTAAGYLGLLLAFAMLGPVTVQHLGDGLTAMLDAPARLGRAGDLDTRIVGRLSWAASAATLPIFLFPAVAVLMVILAQRGLIFRGSKLVPKLSRISPIANARNKFGRGGLFEFFKSFTKLVAYSTVLAGFLHMRSPQFLGLLETSSRAGIAVMAGLVVDFLIVVTLCAAAIGLLDFLWQRAEHLRRNRMSDQDLRDENKEAEGDPHLKNRRRQRAQDLALNQMMAAVPKADVVVVNPTHYAVALSWSRMRGDAPKVVAKGVDEIARRIREAAQEAGVPIHSDPPTARAIFETTEVGDEIRPAHYRAVAAAIRFSDRMRKRARSGAGLGR